MTSGIPATSSVTSASTTVVPATTIALPDVETAVAAIKKGAYDFVEKPFNADRLILAANRALEAARLI